MGHQYEAISSCYFTSLQFIITYIVAWSYLYCFYGNLGGLSRWLFLSRVVFLSDGLEQTHFYRPPHPSSPSPRTSSLLFFSTSVHGKTCRQIVACWGGHADDIMSTSAPVLLCNLDTIPLITPELCPRSRWKVVGQIRQ